MTLKNNKYMPRFFAIAVLYCLAANFAHPATPTLIQNLGLPDYMFGVAFAGMSITNFLFSPFWGKIGDQVGRTKVMLISGIGYGIGQAMFGMATTEIGILLARMVSGFFIGGFSVSQLSYIMDNSTPELKGKNFTLLATIQSLFSAFGFLVGGFLSEVSMSLMFGIQFVLLALAGILTYALIRDNPEMSFQKRVNLGSAARAANPLGAFFKVGREMSKVLLLLSVIALVVSFAATSYDQCFNYFIKDQLNFSPSNNGVLKAGFGIIGLIANMTVGLWIMRRTNLYKSLSIILMLSSMGLVGLLFPSALPIFVVNNIILFSLNALYNPTVQAAYAGEIKAESQNGAYMGVFSSLRALGSVIGSLFAGFIYATGPRLSFLYAMVAFMAATVLAFIALAVKRRQSKA